MSILKDGGPAFPVDANTAHLIAIAQVGSNDEQAYIKALAQAAHGMTVRVYLASKFMDRAQSLCEKANPNSSYADIARCCFAMADAMLKESQS